MVMQRVCANTLYLPVVPRRKSPAGDYEFVHEDDYDMNSVAGRIAWFCDEFEVERPRLQLDPENPTAPEGILLTEDLTKWFQKSGMSYDFAFVGGAISDVAAFRRQHLTKNTINNWAAKLDLTTQQLLIEKLNSVVDGKISMEVAMAEFKEEVKIQQPQI